MAKVFIKNLGVVGTPIENKYESNSNQWVKFEKDGQFQERSFPVDTIEYIKIGVEITTMLIGLFRVKLPLFITAGDTYGLTIRHIRVYGGDNPTRCVVSYQNDKGEYLFTVVKSDERKARKEMKRLLKQKLFTE